MTPAALPAACRVLPNGCSALVYGREPPRQHLDDPRTVADVLDELVGELPTAVPLPRPDPTRSPMTATTPVPIERARARRAARRALEAEQHATTGTTP